MGVARVPSEGALGGIVFWCCDSLLGFGYFGLPVGVNTFPIRAASKAPKGPTFTDFREAVFFGIKWQWDYDFHDRVTAIRCLCPTCDRVLNATQFWDRGYGARVIAHTKFKCNSCGVVALIDKKSLDEIKNDLNIEIDVHLRNGAWKKYVHQPEPQG